MLAKIREHDRDKPMCCLVLNGADNLPQVSELPSVTLSGTFTQQLFDWTCSNNSIGTDTMFPPSVSAIFSTRSWRTSAQQRRQLRKYWTIRWYEQSGWSWADVKVDKRGMMEILYITNHQRSSRQTLARCESKFPPILCIFRDKYGSGLGQLQSSPGLLKFLFAKLSATKWKAER